MSLWNEVFNNKPCLFTSYRLCRISLYTKGWNL